MLQIQWFDRSVEESSLSPLFKDGNHSPTLLLHSPYLCWDYFLWRLLSIVLDWICSRLYPMLFVFCRSWHQDGRIMIQLVGLIPFAHICWSQIPVYFTEVLAPSQESDWSCICLLGVSIGHLSTIFIGCFVFQLIVT